MAFEERSEFDFRHLDFGVLRCVTGKERNLNFRKNGIVVLI